MSAVARRRAAAAGVAAVLVVLAVVLIAGRGGDGPAPPAQDAARLVPAGALAYVHLSTDTGRPAVRRASRLAASFPGWPALRDRVLRGLTAPRCGVTRRSLRGREAALAILPGRAPGPSARWCCSTPAPTRRRASGRATAAR